MLIRSPVVGGGLDQYAVIARAIGNIQDEPVDGRGNLRGRDGPMADAMDAPLLIGPAVGRVLAHHGRQVLPGGLQGVVQHFSAADVLDHPESAIVLREFPGLVEAAVGLDLLDGTPIVL